MHLANKSNPDVWRFRRSRFLKKDQVFSGCGAASTMLGGPVDACIAGFEQHSLPLSIVGTSSWPIVR
jgi:hypothetical protein